MLRRTTRMRGALTRPAHPIVAGPRATLTRAMTAAPAGTPFRTQIRVRYEETDAAGVVYYANYLRYFEVARAWAPPRGEDR